MSWLTAHANTLLNLDQDKQNLADLMNLGQLLASEPLADGTDNPIALLEKLRRGDVDLDVLKDKSEVLKRLQEWYQKAVESSAASNKDIARLRRLLMPLSEACAAKGDDTADWIWPAEGGVAIPEKLDIQLKAALSGKAQIRMEVCPSLPDKGGQRPVDSVVLMLGVDGSLDVQADIGLPIGNFAVAAQASASGGFSSEFYSLHPGSMICVPAISAAISRLNSSPFDLAAIGKRFSDHELQCIKLTGRGKLDMGGRIALASPMSLADKSVQLAIFSCGYTATMVGEFDYTIRADEKQYGNIALYLRRRRGNGSQRQVEVKIGLDLTSAYQRIHKELQPNLKKTTELLQGVETWLAPGEMIQEQLRKSIGKLDSNHEKLLAPLLESLLGFKPGRNVTDALCLALTEEVVKIMADLEGDIQTRADAIVDSLVSRLGLSSSHRQDVIASLSDKVNKGLAKLRAKVDGDLKKLADKKSAKEISDVLDEIGEKFQSNLDEVDAKLAGLRLLMQRYRGMAEKLYKGLEAVSEVKVEANLNHLTEHSDERSVDLALSFDPTVDAAKQAWRQALLGSFGQAMELAGSKKSGVEIRECAVQHVVGDSEKNTLQVAVLGFALESSSLLRRNTQIDIEADGNISVLSEGAISKLRALGNESKTIRFANAYALATAKRTQSLQLSVSLSYEDKNLKMGEVKGFFDSLVTAGLLSEGAKKGAVQFLGELDSNAPGLNKQGRLDVSLPLSADELQSLLGVSQSLDVYSATVKQVAAQEMATVVLAQEASLTREANVLKELSEYTLSTIAPTLVGNILTGVGPARGGHTDDIRRWNLAEKINRFHALCDELAETLVAMRKLYESSFDDLKHWTPEIWQEKQESILLRAKGNVPGDFPSVFGEKVRPRTLALFRILARLSGRLDAYDDVLTATMTLGSGEARQVRRIA